MLRAIWFFIKVSVLVALVVWVAERPGTIAIDWMSYRFTFHVGFFLLLMMATVVLGIVIFSIFKTIFDAPKNFRRYRDIRAKDKGLRALTLGLTAVAAGDAKAARYQSHRARSFLGDDEGLAKLLTAQAARLAGEEVDAARGFAALIEDKDAGFLGVRGLLQAALDHGDYEGAREIGHRALEMYPKQEWILRIVYDLEIRLHHWGDALKILYRAEKCGAIPVNKANSDRVAMLLAQSDLAKEQGDETTMFRTLQKAYGFDPRFVPTVLRLARMYLNRGKPRAAVDIISKAWMIAPHPELVTLWREAAPAAAEKDSAARIRWFERLLDLKPDSVEALQALAGVLIQEGMWADARRTLEKAENIRPNVELYKLWAKLEERATQDAVAVRAWLEKAADAPRERVWICAQTGRVYESWVPVSDQGLFNTIIWDFPIGRAGVAALAGTAPRRDVLLLESV